MNIYHHLIIGNGAAGLSAAEIPEFEACIECHPTGIVNEFDDEDAV